MPALLVSDLHLDASRPEATTCFLRFLAGPGRDADQLYILGDLFEAWVGDDAADAHGSAVAAALAAFTATGRRCAFLAGNRDFLLGSGFATRAGIELLADEHVAELAGVRALLMHGDLLCTDDRAYQRYRALVHRPLVRAAFLSLPVAIRRRVAAHLRVRSQAANAGKAESIMDVNGRAVRSALDRHGVTTLVHGHTHRPAIHSIETSSGPGQRIVLGAWHTAGSVLRFTGIRPELVSLPFG